MRIARLILLGGIFTLATLAAARADSADSAADWLMKINRAAAELSFQGMFVYAHDRQIEAMQVVRRVQDGMMQERLYSLNGAQREIVRDRDRIWCYLSDRKVGMRDYRQVFQSGFPRILPGDITRLQGNYHFTAGGVDRIADRMAQRIDVTPNDEYRYGYRLWADIDSGLLLRSDLLGQEREVIEQYLFVSIEVDREISDRALQAVSDRDQLVWQDGGQGQPAGDVTESDWHFRQLPAGYRVTRHMRRTSPGDGLDEEHIIITDGLSTVSVFIEQPGRAQSEMEGLTRMGAVHAYRDTIHDHRITVMGASPARTVEWLAAQVVYTP